MTKDVHFLLVEDNEDHAELIRQNFCAERLANRLDHVINGEDALRYLKREGRFCASPRPDVILLDLNLPGMSGLEVLASMKRDQTLKRIPVVVLTTSQAERDRASAYEHHANSYVAKPVDFSRLQDVVRQLELYWTICNQPPAWEDA
jgi:CheY-like chemotaxis protein